MSSIVVLSGSMRKGGNTDILVKSFANGAGEKHTVEVLSVADLNVNPCNGCNACFRTEGNHCVQNDDMALVYEKLGEADILVIASPVYFYGISARLKAIIDRLHTPMRNTFHIKKLALILVGAAELPELFDAIIRQYQLVLDFFHLEDGGMVLVRGAKNIGDVKCGDGLARAFDLGKTIGIDDPICRIAGVHIDRIAEHEEILHEAEQLLDRGSVADAQRLKWLTDRLGAYYTSAEWKNDYAADEAGLLPADLKRGVLSENGIFNVLERYREWTDRQSDKA